MDFRRLRAIHPDVSTLFDRWRIFSRCLGFVSAIAVCHRIGTLPQMPFPASPIPLLHQPPHHSAADGPDTTRLQISPWAMAVGWTAAHGLMFWILGAVTWLVFQQHPRVGQAWGILLHYLLPAAIGLLQAVFLRKWVRHCWIWFPATLLGVPFCLLLNDGWGVLPTMGFGFGVTQAVLLRPRGPLICTFWIMASGIGWFLPWVGTTLLSPFFNARLSGDASMEISPVLATAWTGLVYGTLTSPIFFWLTARGLPGPKEQNAWLDWLTPCGMYLLMMALWESAGRNFDMVMLARNSVVALLFGRSDSTLTRWADPFSIGIFFLGSELAYQVLTVAHRWSVPKTDTD